MLIGIVFGSYYAIQSKAGEPVTLWTQVRRAVQTAAETRQFGVWGWGFLKKPKSMGSNGWKNQDESFVGLQMSDLRIF